LGKEIFKISLTGLGNRLIFISFDVFSIIPGLTFGFSTPAKYFKPPE
jgi:hypothetical protein